MSAGTATAIISPSVFFGVAWTLVGVCLVLLAFRLYVRISSYGRLYADDVFAIAAWVFFIGSNILWHFRLSAVYVLADFEVELILPGLDQINSVLLFLKYLVAFDILFLCSLWSIKFSFILFFRRLGDRLTQTYIKIWWWIVMIITIATFAVSVGTFDYDCTTAGLEALLANCLNEAAKDREARETRINTSMDIVSDALIITVPVVILWDARLPSRQKLGLIGIFGLSLLTMIFALIRILVLPAKTASSDFTWTFLWTNIEMGVAIMVACLGSFRQLYVNKRDKDQKGHVRSDSASGSFHFGWILLTNVRSIFTRGSSRSKSSSKGLLDSRSTPFSGQSSEKYSEALTELSSTGENNRNPLNTMTTNISSQTLRVPKSIYADPERDAWTMDRSKYIDDSPDDSQSDVRDDDLENHGRPFYHAHDGTSSFNIDIEQSFVIESNAALESGREYSHSREYIRKPSR